MSRSVLTLILITSFAASNALASTSLVVQKGMVTKHATSSNDGGVKPSDFITYGAGEDQDFLLVCYSGNPSEVKDIFKQIVAGKQNWSFGRFEVFQGIVHAELKKEQRGEKDRSVFIQAYPCR